MGGDFGDMPELLDAHLSSDPIRSHQKQADLTNASQSIDYWYEKILREAFTLQQQSLTHCWSSYAKAIV
jgi:hypothetical protein